MSRRILDEGEKLKKKRREKKIKRNEKRLSTILNVN